MGESINNMVKLIAWNIQSKTCLRFEIHHKENNKNTKNRKDRVSCLQTELILFEVS